METGFWHERWQRHEIGWHESAAHPFLVEHFPLLKLAKGGRVFLPLCGKTLDIAWLLASGYRVVGAELSEIAINELFHELGLVPIKAKVGKFARYTAKGIDIFVGDIFDLSAELLGPVHAIYDRAALVALPASMRDQYTPHLGKITGTAPQLLITFEYNQQMIDGPPFSISADEVKRHYGGTCFIKSVASKNVVDGLKGKVPATERVWLLQPANNQVGLSE